MAGMRPFFLTGANAKIKVNNRTLAYVSSLSYSVQVKHATPTVLGMYEPSSIEPTGYIVTGSFSVVRYIADATKSGGKQPDGTTSTGNGIGYWGKTRPTDGRAHEALNPSKLKNATGFDIEIYQKICGANISVARIRNARITRADLNMGTKRMATQTFNFTAIYADEDSFLADSSGTGQQFS